MLRFNWAKPIRQAALVFNEPAAHYSEHFYLDRQEEGEQSRRGRWGRKGGSPQANEIQEAPTPAMCATL